MTAESAVNESVREAAKRFKDLGATVETVSIRCISLDCDLDADRHRGHDPDHDVRRWLWPLPVRPLFDLADGFPSRLARQADSLSETTKLFLMLGTYINNTFGPRYYGKALNISRRLTPPYDKAFAEYDLLLLPRRR